MRRVIDRLGWGAAAALAIALVAVIAGAVRAGPLDPPGAPGSTPGVRLPGTPITQPGSFPIVINQPGSYYLAENITGVSGQDGIDIAANDVTLDLNGFTVKGVVGSLHGINVSLENDVVIRNGTVTGWGQNGINTVSGTHGRIEGIIASSNAGDGITFGFTYSVLRDCQAYGNGNRGATIFGSSSLIEHCSFSNNVGQGAQVTGGVNRIADNLFASNGANGCCTGLWVTGASNLIEHNTALANGNYGIWFDGPTNIAVANLASFNLNGPLGAQYNITGSCGDCDIAAMNTAGNAPTYWANIDR
jgi:hypothetical protein